MKGNAKVIDTLNGLLTHEMSAADQYFIHSRMFQDWGLEELYERLKQKGVLVVSGHYFFPGIDEDWAHKDECIRVTYAQDNDVVEKGLSLIASEIREIHSR